MKISISNQISLTKSILFEFLIKRSAKLGKDHQVCEGPMESPFRAWGDMGARRPISTILSRTIWDQVCALTTLPLILFNIFLLILSWLSQNLKNFCCWMLHVLRKSTSSCAVSGHFSWLADGPAFYSGQSAVAPKVVPEPSPKLVVSLV